MGWPHGLTLSASKNLRPARCVDDSGSAEQAQCEKSQGIRGGRVTGSGINQNPYQGPLLNPESAMSSVTKKQTESDNFLAECAEETKESRESRFFHPYLQLFISVVLTAVSQILLKIGVDTQFVSPWYTTSNLFAFWIWFGILAIIGSLFSWLFALKSVPLIIAFNLAATNHIMVAIGSWLFLGETISSQRRIGILLVALGVFFVGRSAARVEERL